MKFNYSISTRLPSAWCAATALALWTAIQPAAAADGLSWDRETDSLALSQAGKVVWRFNYGTNTTKPFFHPIAVPGGPTLTWDRPPDHPWHHALWFSWKYLNQVNYWETEAKDAAAHGLTEWSKPRWETKRDFSARIVIDLTYRPPNEQPVLTEHRTIAVSPPDQEGCYHLDWTMNFTATGKDVLFDRTPLPGEPGGQPWGGYAGLSVRFAKEIKDPQAIMPQATATFADGRYRGRAVAMDYTGQFDGQDAGIAILDYPPNLNSPSPWYVISDSVMHYFSPAVIQQKSYLLNAGQSFTLRYRVVVHPGRWSSERLSRTAGDFAAEKLSSRLGRQ